jgi:phycocyanobilin lyase subunit beta
MVMTDASPVSTTDITSLLAAVEAADSTGKLVVAVQQLAAAQSTAAIPTLIAALGYNNPGAAVAAVEGLVQLGDEAVRPLLELLDGYNYSARAWALRALAGIAHPLAFETLLTAARDDFALSVRRAAARGLGTLRWQLLEPAARNAAQAEALDVLAKLTQDPEWVVRYAAIAGLQALAVAIIPEREQLIASILQQLEQVAQIDEDVSVQTRAYLACEQIAASQNSVVNLCSAPLSGC